MHQHAPDRAAQSCPYSRSGSPRSVGKSSARQALKSHTADLHDATERAFEGFDLACADGYRAFISAHAAAILPLEEGFTAEGWAGYRARSADLLEDCEALRIAPLLETSGAPRSPGAIWGMQYVIEGSRLGGKQLVKQVPEGTTRAYLSPPSDLGTHWNNFCDALDQEAAREGPEWLEDAKAGARHLFLRFTECAMRHTPTGIAA
ncbi:biliverdin-producing heme oxygenase [Erythrobacter sp. HKB08]|uniref:biliverdin-producing heme oxygenase n=1 Tax=Erythrobacter sp. HKB08 TaxID=2502843 RepID=UPI001008A1D0|nr:biliverdin-producing heme oxygenase [Erythrobacter sp. HKB08]